MVVCSQLYLLQCTFIVSLFAFPFAFALQRRLFVICEVDAVLGNSSVVRPSFEEVLVPFFDGSRFSLDCSMS